LTQNKLVGGKVPGYFYFLQFKKTRQAYGLITPPLRENRSNQLVGDAVEGCYKCLDNQEIVFLKIL
jgi:hypothetical protein